MALTAGRSPPRRRGRQATQGDKELTCHEIMPARRHGSRAGRRPCRTCSEGRRPVGSLRVVSSPLVAAPRRLAPARSCEGSGGEPELCAIVLRSSGVPAQSDFRLTGPLRGSHPLAALIEPGARKTRLSRPFGEGSGGGGIRTLDGPIRPITVSRPPHFGRLTAGLLPSQVLGPALTCPSERLPTCGVGT